MEKMLFNKIFELMQLKFRKSLKLKLLMKMITMKIGLVKHTGAFRSTKMLILTMIISEKQLYSGKVKEKDISLTKFNIILNLFLLNGNYDDGLIKLKQEELNEKRQKMDRP